MSRIALLAALALTTSALGLGVGCGGGGDAEDRARGLTPDQVLDRSRDATEALRSYRVAADARIEVTAAPGAVAGTAARLLSDPILIEGEGSVERPDSVTFDLTTELSGLPVQANVTKIGGDLYLTALGQDFKVDLPAAQVALVRPAELAPSLVEWLDDPREVGRETIDNVETVHLRGGVDVDAVVDDVGGLLRQAPGLAGGQAPGAADLATARRQIRAAVREEVVDVWVGTEDFLPRRVAVRLLLAGRTDLLPELRRAGLDLKADLSQFDEPVQITPPADPQPLDPGNLGDLAP